MDSPLRHTFNHSRWILLVAPILWVGAPLARVAAQDAPAPLRLAACIDLGMTNQPALKASQASLASAQSGARGLNNLPPGAGLLSPDLRIRRQQACLGVGIAEAGLMQTEWETRYAVTRNYYSVQYARLQSNLVKGLVERLDDAKKKLETLVKNPGKDVKVTRLDVNVLEINLEIVKRKAAQAKYGELTALAALREAMGVSLDFPLNVALNDLPPLVTELDKSALIDMALTGRGEMAQAASANRLTELEISAQSRLFFKIQTKTFASGADVHARPIPQGEANDHYRPSALGIEMPIYLVGPRRDRIQRARDLNDRANAVVEKTYNLIALEVEATYFKWAEAVDNLQGLNLANKKANENWNAIQDGFNSGKVSAEEYLRARGLVDQTQALYNEALYHHALALAAMERVTAGGYRIPVAAKH